jgi:hypothetical protein
MLKDEATITEAETEGGKKYWEDFEKDGQTSYKFGTGIDQEDHCVRTEELQGLLCNLVAKKAKSRKL